MIPKDFLLLVRVFIVFGLFFLVFSVLSDKDTCHSENENLFHEEHFSKRLNNLQEEMKRGGLDAFVISDSKSIYYICGSSYKAQERPFFIVVFSDEELPTFLVPKLEEEHMIRKSKLQGEVISYFEFPTQKPRRWIDKMKEILGTKKNVMNVAVEPSLTLENFNIMKMHIPESIFETNEMILKQRFVKSEKEIEGIRKTSKYADEGMSSMLNNAYYGISALEVFLGQKSFESNLKLTEIPLPEFDPLQLDILNFIFPSPYSALPHGVPPLSARLETGPHIAISYLKVNGYAAECERTIFLSEPSERERVVFKDMLTSRNLALELLRTSIIEKKKVHCSEIDKISMDFLKEKGYEKYLLHRTGHGIGHDNHEGPWISVGCDTYLEPGMVISIEPGIYIPELGGFRHSDTVLITENGYELLTNYPVDIESLIIKSGWFSSYIKGPFLKWYLGIYQMEEK